MYHRNPVKLFAELFVVFFTIIALFDAVGFVNQSATAGASGNVTKLTNVWATGFTSTLYGDLIWALVISLVGSIIATAYALSKNVRGF